MNIYSFMEGIEFTQEAVNILTRLKQDYPDFIRDLEYFKDRRIDIPVQELFPDQPDPNIYTVRLFIWVIQNTPSSLQYNYMQSKCVPTPAVSQLLSIV